MNKLAVLLLAIIGVFGLALPVAAWQDPICSHLSGDDWRAAGCQNVNARAEVDRTVINGINAALYIIGIIAVIIIIVGGIRYIMSRGDPATLKKAKDTITYAIIGLIVAILAFPIVNFGIDGMIKGGGGGGGSGGENGESGGSSGTEDGVGGVLP